jgi:hypothetical protein
VSLSPSKKRLLVQEAKRLTTGIFPGLVPQAACVSHAMVLQALAYHRHGLRLVPQAGSAAWQRIPHEMDDGHIMTHFGYEWRPDDQKSDLARRLGLLPEVHVWLGDPERQEIVDITTGMFPDQAKAIRGYDWPGKLPPPFIWCGTDEIPPEARYVPSRDATIYVWSRTDVQERLREVAETVRRLK